MCYSVWDGIILKSSPVVVQAGFLFILIVLNLTAIFSNISKLFVSVVLI